jgi:hypothetical protein
MIPEDLPVTEGLELARDIQGELDQQPHLILNRFLDCPLTLEQLQQFKGQEFADYLSVVLRRQSEARKTVENRGLPVRVLPWIFTNNVSDKIRLLAGQMNEEAHS